MEQKHATPAENLLHEAPGVAWVDLYGTTKHGQVVRISITARGLSTREALDDLIETIQYADEAYKMRPYNPYERNRVALPKDKQQVQPEDVDEEPIDPQDAMNHDTPVMKPVKKAYTREDAAKKNDRPAPVAKSTEPDVNTMTIVRMEITPRPDGRADVVMYDARSKYPNLSIKNWKIDNILEIFPEQWSVGDFIAADVVSGSWAVHWKESSNLNAKGNPYKDVVLVEDD